jgi:hypothetical protein
MKGVQFFDPNTAIDQVNDMKIDSDLAKIDLDLAKIDLDNAKFDPDNALSPSNTTEPLNPVLISTSTDKKVLLFFF